MNSRSIQILEIFVDSYKDEMLSSLRVDKLLVLNNHEDEFKILIRNCTMIDLSNCGIDEDHDILIHIANFCQNLQVLKMNRNSLSSKSLRLMFGLPTLPKKNLVKLNCLEIAGNTKITIKGIEQYVLSLVKSLQKIAFSWNDILEADRVMNSKNWQRSISTFSETIETHSKLKSVKKGAI